MTFDPEQSVGPACTLARAKTRCLLLVMLNINWHQSSVQPGGLRRTLGSTRDPFLISMLVQYAGYI